MKNALNRLREPSTWTALGSLGGIFGVPALAVVGVPEVATAAASVVSLLLGVALREKGSAE